MSKGEIEYEPDYTDNIDDACEQMFGHREWEFVNDDRKDSFVVRFFIEGPPRCDLCDDDTHVGFVDDACTFKVCKYCDTDGSTFAPKNWPIEVLNEIGLDRDGEMLRTIWLRNEIKGVKQSMEHAGYGMKDLRYLHSLENELWELEEGGEEE